jgi:hypothetical protein
MVIAHDVRSAPLHDMEVQTCHTDMGVAGSAHTDAYMGMAVNHIRSAESAPRPDSFQWAHPSAYEDQKLINNRQWISFQKIIE